MISLKTAAVALILTYVALSPSERSSKDQIGGTHFFIRENKMEKTKCLLLSCMDYRFIQSTAELLERLEYEKAYDYFILAGASLGYNAGPTSWQETWLEHINLAKQLHQIQEIIVVEHEDCGYYKQFYGRPDTFGMHLYNVRTFVPKMKSIHPELKFSAYLVTLTGQVIPLLSE